MMKSSPWRCLALAALAPLFSVNPASAQTTQVDWGVELATSYVWRGFQYDRAVQFQPWLSATRGGFTLGTWGSYGLDGEYMEQDLFISWYRELDSGSFSLTLFDYYFTEDFGDWFEWGGVSDGEPGGAHTLELIAEYAGPETFPVRVLMASTVYNDPSASIYGEVGYDLHAGGLDWGVTVGSVLRDGGFYGLGSSAVTNLSLSASRSLFEIGDRWVYANGFMAHNPELSDTYFVFVLGF